MRAGRRVHEVSGPACACVQDGVCMKGGGEMYFRGRAKQRDRDTQKQATTEQNRKLKDSLGWGTASGYRFSLPSLRER